MFLIKIPDGYQDHSKIEDPFKELSLSYKLEIDVSVLKPVVVEGKKMHEGEEAITALLEELNDYYGADYNCSCAR